ncbi:guanosine-5'-triphosphate,3'-diphosphate pyrophosphatase [Alteromonas sp. KUL42]|uniref:Ppx/GppA phosphatase family protein n=1 Tax=Alteromonas sp. KUL42 TaxID=2480797 RepID=UPI0007985268|nr:guanosine-5'-triphosphate,3'-diphosphate pyrophosphatase [Alteromonas sp. KUL42]KXJ60481.1 MAG: guanosine-3',5'-bis(diphosphate) 3'-pyrophosphohydrolase [Alteromonas sp. Nap_26]TAP35683.1 guanosine-5'-triphosphate,3'-diphosphate pyrophosphatase [Alteromonas sp. KUL42]GEA07176.1 guanosine-5'-triphosphate,3'-diphosphate pyrophosphatase [Alteromonas sp. KUL42]
MQAELQHNPQSYGEYYAAVDLGSNSFHMVIVHVVNGSVQIIGKIKQKVRLAAGLDEELALDEVSMERGWQCLQVFSERLQDIPPSNIKIVATATLRLATNAQVFIKKAEEILNHKLEVISGEEEARQIYLGVAYTSANQGNSLVIDIGGASTEIVIGNDMQPIHLKSLDMGCVTFMERYFEGGNITQQNFDNAKAAAHALIADVADAFLCFDWENCLGASGTPQAITEILVAQGISDAIRLDYLYHLEKQCIEGENIKSLSIDGLDDSRKPIFPSGLAILISLFEALHIQHMNISGGALREGLIYGMLDNIRENDRRQQTLNQAKYRYHIDGNHANNVQQVALALCHQLCAQQNICHLDTETILGAAAQLHEIGLHIEYKRHHEHGEYILSHIDLPGFTRLQRAAIRDLVAQHRLAINNATFDKYHQDYRPMLQGLLRVLRIAVVLCLRRQNKHIPEVSLACDGSNWVLSFPEGWLKAHPLINAELANECWLQHKAGCELICQ